MPRVTRGFVGRRPRDHRLPPGQYDVGDQWPVLTAERAPTLDTSRWTFRIDGLVQRPVEWTWDEIRALPRERWDGDIHCVTTWSKFGMSWSGVAVDTLLEAAGPLPQARFVVAHSHSGYTTNMPLSDLTGGRAWVAFDAQNAPLTREHGGPARLLVPHLYFWKSAKWVAGLRLVAENGYTAQRSYSVASAPDGRSEIELTVERLDDGEVSEFLHDVAVVGDVLEVRGPVGGWFAWDGVSPALLVGGGSGQVPLAAMLRHARATGRPDLVRMLVSVRTPDDLFYGDELTGAPVTAVFTRTAPPGATRPAGRLTLADVAPLVRGGETAFVCGSPAFAAAAADLLAAAGVPDHAIRIEQFGPTGA